MSRKKTISEVISEFQQIWGDRFDYSQVDYKTTNDRVTIICREHGSFTLMPYQHKAGASCRKCGNITGRPRTSTEDFIAKSKKLFGDRFDYSLTKYIHSHKNVTLICKSHGEFSTKASRHLESGGCPICVRQCSTVEQVWLDSLGIPDDASHRGVNLKLNNQKCLVDGFDPSTNTVYEFHGDFWHGNPLVYQPNDIHPIIGKPFGELHQRTLLKDQLIRESGYQLITIWSSDWDKLNRKRL